LSVDPARRAERALAGAQASFQAGTFDTALELLAAAEAGPLDEFQRARVDLLRGRVAFASGLGPDAPALLLKAARRLEPFDLELARETYLYAWHAAGTAGHAASKGVLLEICRAVQALPPPPGAPGPLDLLLMASLCWSPTDTPPRLRRCSEQAKRVADISVEDVLRWGSLAAPAFIVVWDIEGLHAISARQVQLVRDVGALAELPFSVSRLGVASLWMGDFEDAAAVVAETESVAAAIGSPMVPYTLMRLRAMQGREAEASAAIASAIDAAGGSHGGAVAWAHWAAAILYNGLARYEEGGIGGPARHLGRHPTDARHVRAARACRGGCSRRRHRARTRGARTAGRHDAAMRHRRSARHRGTLPGVAQRRRHGRRAVSRGDRPPQPHQATTRARARASAVWGVVAARESPGRRAAQLRAAYDLFVAIGMDAFADRARRELVATGEKVRRRTVETRDELTAQERQIARLAREGLSNPEIGTRLFLSPRTVEYHLSKVFASSGSGPAGSWPMPCRVPSQSPLQPELAAVEERSDVVRELFRVLIEESVAGVGVDPQLRVRQVPGEEAAVLRGHQRVVVAGGDERWMCDRRQPREL
jgi:DNA-binding CsgD family transcriptional regulator